MEDSVAEEAEASNQEKKKDTTIQIVKLEFIEAEPNKKDDKHTNPIPG
jgi:hypothetical protein